MSTAYTAAAWIAFHGASHEDRERSIRQTAIEKWHNPAILAKLHELAAISDVAQLHANVTGHAPDVAEVIERAGAEIVATLPPPALHSIIRDLIRAEGMS